MKQRGLTVLLGAAIAAVALAGCKAVAQVRRLDDGARSGLRIGGREKKKL